MRLKLLRRSSTRGLKALPDWAIATVGGSILLLPQLWRPGPEMDEGMVLSYAVRILKGAVPYRDFQTFYGPGNLWAVGGAFEVFGAHQVVERLVGLTYVLVAAVALCAIVGRASRRAALASVVLVVSIATDSGVWAYATRGAVAFLIAGIALGTGHSRSSERPRLAAAGACAGAAILFRFDFILPVLMSSPFVVSNASRRARIAYVAAGCSSVALYAPYLALAGMGGVRRTARDILASSPGRRLPIPVPTSLPAGALLLGGGLALTFIFAIGIVRWRRRAAHWAPLLAVGLAVVGAVPMMFSRADAAHIEPIALLVFGTLPLAAALHPETFETNRILSNVAAFGIALSLVWGVGALLARLLVVDARAVAKRSSSYAGSVVRSEGRSFILADKQEEGQVQSIASILDRQARPGQRLFVGPLDLRRTFNGPTYLYFLFPRLTPASYYMEFNPWTANRPGSGLSHDLMRARWLILDSKWDAVYEPNASRRLGSSAPNRVVRDDFCLLDRAGTYRLYEARSAAKCETPRSAGG